MSAPFQLINLLFDLVYFIIIAGVVLSWVRLAVGSNASWIYHPVVRFVDDLSFRILRPFRAVFNKACQAMGIHRPVIDLSPILAIFCMDLLRNFIIRILLGLG